MGEVLLFQERKMQKGHFNLIADEAGLCCVFCNMMCGIVNGQEMLCDIDAG